MISLLKVNLHKTAEECALDGRLRYEGRSLFPSRKTAISFQDHPHPPTPSPRGRGGAKGSYQQSAVSLKQERKSKTQPVDIRVVMWQNRRYADLTPRPPLPRGEGEQNGETVSLKQGKTAERPGSPEVGLPGIPFARSVVVDGAFPRESFQQHSSGMPEPVAGQQLTFLPRRRFAEKQPRGV